MWLFSNLNIICKEAIEDVEEDEEAEGDPEGEEDENELFVDLCVSTALVISKR